MPGHPKIQAESHSSNWPFQFCRRLKILQLLLIKRLNITKSIGNNFLPIFNFVKFIKRKIFECFREITYHKSKYLQEFHPCQNYIIDIDDTFLDASASLGLGVSMTIIVEKYYQYLEIS